MPKNKKRRSTAPSVGAKNKVSKRSSVKPSIKKVLKPIRRTIVRRRSKKTGRVYFYNKNLGKISSKKSWKSLNTRIASRKKEIIASEKAKAARKRRKKKVVKKVRKEKTRYQKVHAIVRKYVSDNDIRVSRRFNEYVGNIYRATLDVPLNRIKKDIAQIWKKYSGFVSGVAPKKKFPQRFKFYFAREKFNNQVFEGVELSISMNDPNYDFSTYFEGASDQFSEWFTTSGLYRHLRTYYDESPEAEFVLTETDQRTFAKYEVQAGLPPGVEPPPPPTELLPQAPERVPSAAPTVEEKKVPGVSKEEAELERVKERRRAMETELELIKKWEELGLSKKEIRERLKKFREGGEV